MIYLLSDEGRDALRALVNRPILYGFDFDGTLARISHDRDAVKLSRSIHEWLSELAKRAACVVVSGRALSDLTPRINGAVPYLIGNHGLESPLASPVTLIWASNICVDWMKRVKGDMARSLRDLDVELEFKRYSLTFHYRGTDEPATVRAALIILLNQLVPAPRLIFGKASVNVLPPGKSGKGQAALALMVHLGQTGLFFIGDDETDEDVFELTEGLAMGVRVGGQSESKAKYFINHQGEVEDVLRFLIHRLDRTPESFGRRDGNGSEGADRATAL